MCSQYRIDLSNCSTIQQVDYEINYKDLSSGSNKYAVITTGSESYFLKYYPSIYTSPDWETDGRHILKKINQDQSKINDWISPKYEYEVMESIKISQRQCGIPTPVEYLEEINGILMENIRNAEVILPQWTLFRLIFILQSEDKIKQVNHIASCLACLHNSTKRKDLKIEQYIRHHQTLADLSSLPNSVSRFFDEFDYSDICLPVVRCHGDFSPRNILITEDYNVFFVDWALSVVSHPLVDVHYFLNTINRWKSYPHTSTNLLNELSREFKDSYLRDLSFNISCEEFAFTKLTSLIRYYWLFIDYKSSTKDRVLIKSKLKTHIFSIMDQLTSER